MCVNVVVSSLNYEFFKVIRIVTFTVSFILNSKLSMNIGVILFLVGGMVVEHYFSGIAYKVRRLFYIDFDCVWCLVRMATPVIFTKFNRNDRRYGGVTWGV